MAAVKSDHAACSDIIASKKAEIQQLKTLLRAAEDRQSSLGDEAVELPEQAADLELQHEPCAGLIAQLQNRLAEMQALESKRQDNKCELGAAVATQDADALREKLALIEAEMRKEVGFSRSLYPNPFDTCLSMVPCLRELKT